MAETYSDLFVGNVSPFAIAFHQLPLVAAIAFLVVIVLLPWWRNTAATGYALVVGLTVFLYGVFLGLFNVSEATRFMANIQDLAVLSMVLIVAVAISQIYRAAVAIALAIWRR
jgi:hypothetical protein